MKCGWYKNVTGFGDCKSINVRIQSKGRQSRRVGINDIIVRPLGKSHARRLQRRRGVVRDRDINGVGPGPGRSGYRGNVVPDQGQNRFRNRLLWRMARL